MLDLSLLKPVGKVVTNANDNYTRRKISDNELLGKISDNSLAAYQTASNNNVTKFVNAVSATQNIIGCITSAITAGINAYAQIQVSHDQVRITQIQSAAYVSGKREETEQVRIAQKEETLRSLAKINAELEAKKLEIEREFGDRRENRLFEQEKWRRKVDFMEKKYFNPLFDYANNLREQYRASGFEDEKCRADLLRLEESLQAYVMNINEIYK